MQSAHGDILPIIRNVDNKCCADCTIPLGDFSSIFAAPKYGVWLCADCAAVHEVLSDESKDAGVKKVQGASWTAEEVAAMKRYSSNVAFNKIYERCLIPGWPKCRPDSSVDQRTLYIRAKYVSKLFLFPPPGPEVADKSQKKKRASGSNLSPSLFDMFLVVAPVKCEHEACDSPLGLASVNVQDVVFKSDVTSFFPSSNPSLRPPDNIEAFVYPSNDTVATFFKSPVFFTLALTDESGMRQFCGVLQVHELMSAEDISRVTGTRPGSDRWPAHWPVLYAVKSLIVLSHYPYYNLFREVLEVLYRLSLSASPVPMERYVQHIFRELPLPPQGRVEVSFTIGDRTLTLWRPPKNQLPIMDFSLRPLFSTICVDHIMIIFGALCSETGTCFCSSNKSLLGPISEAFLSFIFPFLWQGTYAPILPDSLTDILEAPVPFIVGLDSRYLVNTPPTYRPDKVLFVDIDNDLLFYGSREKPLNKSDVLVPFPDKLREKLKMKLDEFGGCVYKTDPDIIINTGDIFLRNEHLVPIDRFASEDGVFYQHHGPEMCFSSAVLGNNPTSSFNYLGLSESNRCYVTCSRSSLPVVDILDSCNNANSDYVPGGNRSSQRGNAFDAIEIRSAFLRFFVSTLLNYQDYVKETESVDVSIDASRVAPKRGTFNGAFSSFRSRASESMAAVPKAENPKSNSRPTSLPKSGGSKKSLDLATGRSISTSGVGHSEEDKSYFDTAAFLKDHLGEYYSVLCSTQMFSVFMREQLTYPDQNEIKFFTEAIMDKRNRSKKTILKLNTPFLSDRSDDIRKTFVVAPPSTTGLPPNKRYSYAVFPDMLKPNFGPERKAPVLVQGKEVGRQQNLSRLGGMKSTKALQLESKEKMELLLKQAELRYSKFLKAVIRLQAFRRMRPARDLFVRQVEAARVIQKAYYALRTYRITRNSGARKFHASIKIQAVWRRHLCQERYLKIMLSISVLRRHLPVIRAVFRRLALLRKVRLIQRNYRRYKHLKRLHQLRCIEIVTSVIRMFVAVTRYSRQRRSVIRLQAVIRGHLCFKKSMREREAHLGHMKRLLLIFWKLDHTRLLYRSNFWILLSKGDSSHFNVKLHEKELFRLWTDLGLLSPNGLLREIDPFPVQLDLIKKLVAQPATLESRVTKSSSELNLRRNLESLERQQLYAAMKKDRDEGRRMVFFRKFGLADAKKRKQTLSELVWMDPALADDSAQAVRSIFSVTREQDREFLQLIKSDMLQADVLSVASALLVRVQPRGKRGHRRLSSLRTPRSQNPLITSSSPSNLSRIKSSRL